MDTSRPSSKRSNDNNAMSERQHKQKREKYTSVACNECKQRKIKCSGHSTCQRCDNLGLRCIYASNSSESSSLGTSARFQEMEAKFAALQKQINQIQAMISSSRIQSYISPPICNVPGESTVDGSNSVRSHELEIPYQRRRMKQTRDPLFVGPTSSVYSFEVGKSSLKSMGLQADHEQVATEPDSVLNTPRSSPKPERRKISLLEDTLVRMGSQEALRLIEIYSEELSPIYPFIDMSQTIKHLQELDIPRGPSSFVQPSGMNQNLFDSQDSDILIMVLASALTIEGLGQSTLADQLVDTVEASRSKRSRSMQVSIKEVLIMAMMSVYHFHCDEDVLAWRTIGVAVRLTLEMGLHRRETLFKSFPDHEQRSWATKLFWCIYTLDRRWAVGTGLPYAMCQSDIDTDLPEPDDSSPYLQRLIAYGRISSKVWTAVNRSDFVSARARKEESDYLDFQIQQWVQAIPPELQLLHPKSSNESFQQPRALHRLRVLLHVRANQMRILIHRHNLLSATNLTENVSEAEAVVDVAKDTIQVLAHLNRTSNIYHSQQVCFNYFLVSALAALFLAVCHGPTYFSESCRTEFYLALDLVKEFSSKSTISRRLWRTIRDLKNIGPKLGLSPDTEKMQSSSATVHPQTNAEAAPADQTQAWAGAAVWPELDNASWLGSDEVSDIGNQITYALTDLYEIAQGNPNGNGFISQPLLDTDTIGDYSHLSRSQHPLENNATVSKLLVDLF